MDPGPTSRFDHSTLTRADLHCHSRASDGPAMAALGMIGCPECYSPPERVYDQARARGMDLVAITDHDTIDGAMELVGRSLPGVIVGEEVTVHFPEDRCRLHVLVWGLTPGLHEQIGSLRLRDDVYAFAAWLREHNLAHALAHPLYIQNGRLTRWHIERCVLLFKGFETLNGAHSGTHRDVLEPYLASLRPSAILKLVEAHGFEPLWPRIWEKARTGGSDDHGLLNVGRTWTAVAGRLDAHAFLKAVMAGGTEVGGVAGHSSLLAHQLATVAAHFAADRLIPRCTPRGRHIAGNLMRFAGVHIPRPSRWSLLRTTVARRLLRRRSPLDPLMAALREFLAPVLADYPDLRERLSRDRWTSGAPLSEHTQMAAFADALSERIGRDLCQRLHRALHARNTREIPSLAASLATVGAAQIPYLVSLFHQNKERPFLEKFAHDTLPGRSPLDRSTGAGGGMRVSLFTDTLGDVNGVSRFIRNAADGALATGRDLQVITSTNFTCPQQANVFNFKPIFACTMPGYSNLEFVIPPVTRMLRHLDAHQPDAIHISTPGPVGLVGYTAARMLRIPVLGVYHTDFPAYIDRLFDDHAMTYMTRRYMRFFYSPFRAIFTRSRDYAASLVALGMQRDRLVPLVPGIDTDLFNPQHRDPSLLERLGARPNSVKVLSVGRVSVEKNLPLLTQVWRDAKDRIRREGLDAQLVVVGDGPYRPQMERELAGHDALFVGFRHGQELSALYASSDLFVFPSTTDTLGQVVMEAQASGLPVLVSDQGGPKEVVHDKVTGRVLPADAPDHWVETIAGLIADTDRRTRMGRAAHEFMKSFSFAASFDHFWREHENAWRADLATRGITARGGEETPRHTATVGA